MGAGVSTEITTKIGAKYHGGDDRRGKENSSWKPPTVDGAGRGRRLQRCSGNPLMVKMELFMVAHVQ